MTAVLLFLISPLFDGIPLSRVELVFLLLTLGCMLYVADCWLEARRVLAVAPDPIGVLLADAGREDEAWALAAQACFLLLGLIFAFIPARPDAAYAPGVVALTLASTGLLMLAQAIAFWRAYRRRRNRLRGDAIIRVDGDGDLAVVERRPDLGRRSYDKSPEPTP